MPPRLDLIEPGHPCSNFVFSWRGKLARGMHKPWRRDLALCWQNGETRLPGTLRRKNIPMRTYISKNSHCLEAARFLLGIVRSLSNFQASPQHCCLFACKIPRQYDNSNYRSRGYKISRDHMINDLIGYWKRPHVHPGSGIIYKRLVVNIIKFKPDHDITLSRTELLKF